MVDAYFSPAFGNKPRVLVGRDREMKSLTEGLHVSPGNKERARLIIGQRGLGKTVLLLELADYARKHNYIVASPTVVAGDMLDRILEKLDRDGRKVLPHRQNKVTGGTIGVLGFSAGIQTELPSEPTRSFAYRLLEFCEEAGKAGKGVLILIDEVQSGSEELKKLIIAYQEMVGEGQDIALVFAGLPASVSRTLNQHVLTFFNRASKLYLEPISVPEISIYFRKCFDASGILISDEWVDRAAEVTEGSPYLMQLIGHYIVLSADEGGSLSEKTFERALHLAREEYIGDICETTLSPLSDEDIRVLRAMAEDEQESSIKDLCSRLDRSSAFLQRYKMRLIQAGVVMQPRRGYLKYTVPFLREYFLKTED